VPRYITSHVIACMPHQRLQKLLVEMQTAEGDIRNIRAYADTLQGRMVCEFTAPDGDALNAWLKERNITSQGVFRVEFYAEDAEVTRE
jgi:hypothetical protein